MVFFCSLPQKQCFPFIVFGGLIAGSYSEWAPVDGMGDERLGTDDIGDGPTTTAGGFK